MNCAALGCGKKAGSARPFCLGHWRALSADLQVPSQRTNARIFLGKRDGYIAEVPPRRVVLTDVPGSESD
jgi:hypothetical protein